MAEEVQEPPCTLHTGRGSLLLRLWKARDQDALSLGVQVVVRYRPQEDMLGYLQRDIGPE